MNHIFVSLILRENPILIIAQSQVSDSLFLICDWLQKVEALPYGVQFSLAVKTYDRLCTCRHMWSYTCYEALTTKWLLYWVIFIDSRIVLPWIADWPDLVREQVLRSHDHDGTILRFIGLFTFSLGGNLTWAFKFCPLCFYYAFGNFMNKFSFVFLLLHSMCSLAKFKILPDASHGFICWSYTGTTATLHFVANSVSYI